jgi:hypothetical protein
METFDVFRGALEPLRSSAAWCGGTYRGRWASPAPLDA